MLLLRKDLVGKPALVQKVASAFLLSKGEVHLVATRGHFLGERAEHVHVCRMKNIDEHAHEERCRLLPSDGA